MILISGLPSQNSGPMVRWFAAAHKSNGQVTLEKCARRPKTKIVSLLKGARREEMLIPSEPCSANHQVRVEPSDYGKRLLPFDDSEHFGPSLSRDKSTHWSRARSLVTRCLRHPTHQNRCCSSERINHGFERGCKVRAQIRHKLANITSRYFASPTQNGLGLSAHLK